LKYTHPMRSPLCFLLFLSLFSSPLYSQVSDEELIADVQQLYIGILGRAADQPGLDYWEAEILSGSLTLENVRASFTQQTEYSAIYSGLNSTQLVTLIYQNFLERDPDSAGLSYWTAELDNGLINPDQMVNAIINAVEDPSNTNSQTLVDRSVLTHKVTVASYFTSAFNSSTVDDHYLSTAQQAIAEVDASSASVTSATVYIDEALASRDNSGPEFSCGSNGAVLTADEDPDSYVLFEGGQVRPLALSADGSTLYVTNTPANCLEIYNVSDSSFVLVAAVPVGLEPVAVAINDEDEVWVVNHLSDSVSIVDVSGVPYVSQTLAVGDEPRDIVFAGKDTRRAFISVSYRGQNHPTFNPEDLTTSSLGRGDVWVYDANAPGQGLSGEPVAIVNMFADSLRALAVSQDGETVYAAAFYSGNGTTTLDADLVVDAKPAPDRNVQDELAPDTGLIVRYDGNAWRDEEGTDWSNAIEFSLPDYDVFVIDASASVPAVSERISGVGTTLFNMAVNPINGALYVSNLEALNHIRFEGPGELATTVRGRIAESRITAVTNNSVVPNLLNPHIDFDVDEGASYPAAVVAKSLSQPQAMVVSPDGENLYVAAFGSGKVVSISTAELQTGSYEPNAAYQISLPGRGPAGLALNNDGTRLYVYTRFNNGLVALDTANGDILAEHVMFNPEPAEIIQGRPFLYDAELTSANGTSSCGSCHIFGDNDGLAWDLGNPDANVQLNPNAYVANSPRNTVNFHSMKGPMTTQTFRGIRDSGPQHWRGDRTGENRAVVNGELESIEAAAFKEFNPAFVGLVGRANELSESQMQALTDFALALTPPPNPVSNLDNSLTISQQAGQDIYFNANQITGIGSCNHCHSVDPLQNHFGTNGLMTFEGERVAEDFKIPHLRNMYQKVGKFESGDQIKGFGFLHDGSMGTLDHFFQERVFNFPAPKAANRADVIRFVMVMDSNMAPIVGQQVTLSEHANSATLARLNLLEQRADVVSPRPECDLIASGRLQDNYYSAIRTADGVYLDLENEEISSATLRNLAQQSGQAVTLTCVPPGNGWRLALDR